MRNGIIKGIKDFLLRLNVNIFVWAIVIFTNDIMIDYFTDILHYVPRRDIAMGIAIKLLGIILSVVLFICSVPKFSKHKNINEVKATAKMKLLQNLNLQVNTDIPILLFMNRPTPQKGIDLFVDLRNGLDIDIFEQMSKLMEKRCIFILCGNCDEKDTSPIYTQLKILNNSFNDFVFLDEYSDEIAHELLLASDFYLFPSRFEPCGLSQIYAMRYGVLPIVNPVGGLKDTVINIDSSSEFGTGLYMKSYNFESIVNCLDKAIDLYNSKQWLEIQNRLIKINFSWNKQIKEYINFIA